MFTTASDIIKQKRDKFTIFLRKQRIETVFQIKRAQYLSKNNDQNFQSLSNDNDELDKLARDILDDNISIITRYDSMKAFQIALQKLGNNDQFLEINPKMMEMTSTILLLLNLEDKFKQINSFQLNEVCLGILINITYFMNATQIDTLINLHEFERIFIFLSCKYTNLQNDCLRFLLNVICGLNDQQSNYFLQNFSLLSYINNTYNTWGVDRHFIKKALKLICFCLNKYKGVYKQQVIEESIYTLTCIIENHPHKLSNIYYAVICLSKLFRKINDTETLIATNLPSILNDLLKSQNLEGSSDIKISIIIHTLQILIYLCHNNDQWILSMIKEGIFTTLISLNNNVLKIREKLFELLSIIFYPGFQIIIDEKDLRIDNQQEVVEYLLILIKNLMRSNQELPKYTIQLLSNISLFDVYIYYIQIQVEYFQVMLSEIRRVDFLEYEIEDIINVLISFENMFKYGQKIDNLKSFKEQFISQNGIPLLQKIQDRFSDDQEILEITNNLLDILE